MSIYIISFPLVLYENIAEQQPTRNNLAFTITEFPQLWSFHVEIHPHSIRNNGRQYNNILHIMGNGDTRANMNVYGNSLPGIYWGPVQYAPAEGRGENALL